MMKMALFRAACGSLLKAAVYKAAVRKSAAGWINEITIALWKQFLTQIGK